MTNRQKTINEIADEFKTNGGLSLKDAIDRIEKRQEETTRLLETQTERDEKWKLEITERLVFIDNHLDKHNKKIAKNSRDIKQVKG